MTQRRGRNANTMVDIGDAHMVEVLPYSGSTKYLGRKLNFDTYHKTEIDNRITAGWRKFNLLRHELTSKTYPLGARLRLFNATVQPTVMYGCQSWTMTQELSTTLRRAQRRMMRLIVNSPRRRTTPPLDNEDHHHDESTDDVNSNATQSSDLEQLLQLSEQELLEPWPDFLKRTTQQAEELAKQHNIDDWATHYLRQKWRWAARVAQQSHDRWSRLATTWEPQLHEKRPCSRLNSRPRRRWDDDINHFLDNHYHPQHQSSSEAANSTNRWLHLATDTTLWNELEEDFITITTSTTTNTTPPSQPL